MLHQIRQHIDRVLSDPQLTPDRVAAHAGVSTRTLQKLFGTSGQTFTHYLRLRRLTRCRADLANPLLVHESISDICTRWGFTDAAHFSRAFRERYRLSPRAYRRETGVALSKRVWQRAASAAQRSPDSGLGSSTLQETGDSWVVSIEAEAVQLLGTATTALYHRMTQVLTSLHADQSEARSAVELGMEIAITPGKRSWQLRGTLSKARLPVDCRRSPL